MSSSKTNKRLIPRKGDFVAITRKDGGYVEGIVREVRRDGTVVTKNGKTNSWNRLCRIDTIEIF